MPMVKDADSVTNSTPLDIALDVDIFIGIKYDICSISKCMYYILKKGESII